MESSCVAIAQQWMFLSLSFLLLSFFLKIVKPNRNRLTGFEGDTLVALGGKNPLLLGLLYPGHLLPVGLQLAFHFSLTDRYPHYILTKCIYLCSSGLDLGRVASHFIQGWQIRLAQDYSLFSRPLSQPAWVICRCFQCALVNDE